MTIVLMGTGQAMVQARNRSRAALTPTRKFLIYNVVSAYMVFVFLRNVLPISKVWLAQEDGADVESTRSRSVDLTFRPEALHFKFAFYASTARPDEFPGGFDLAAFAAACTGRRRTKHGIGHPRSGH